MYKKSYLLMAISISIFSGCATIEVQKSISSYEQVANKVNLGDSKEKVLALVEPSQKNLSSDLRKNSEKYIKNNHLFEVYYVRSALQQDGLTTDDEFTPYVFKDGKLIAIGWSYLGGTKTQGQSRKSTIINYTAPATTPVQTFTPTPYVPYKPYG